MSDEFKGDKAGFDQSSGTEAELERLRKKAHGAGTGAGSKTPEVEQGNEMSRDARLDDLARKMESLSHAVATMGKTENLPAQVEQQPAQRAVNLTTGVDHGAEYSPPNATPVQLVQAAMAAGMTITAETITAFREMFLLETDYRKELARQSYNRDFSAWKALGIQAERTVPVDYSSNGGRVRYVHDDLGVTLAKVNETMGPFGLACRFRISDPPAELGWPAGTQRVWAVCAHRDGHFEETYFDCPPDSTGAKNGIQARGSAVSYGMRYALNALLGIAPPKDVDESLLPISDDDIAQIEDALTSSGKTAEDLCAYLQRAAGAHCESLADIRRAQYVLVQRWLDIDPNKATQSSKAADLEKKKPAKKKATRKKRATKAAAGAQS